MDREAKLGAGRQRRVIYVGLNLAIGGFSQISKKKQ